MWHEDKKYYLLSGQQLNQILMMLQMISDRNPDIEKLNESKKSKRFKSLQ